ncbi:major facilitator superfamily protein [Diplocarpon rosae]|nr:major facilitator superfamily protein [Diplocarpon rosae]
MSSPPALNHPGPAALCCALHYAPDPRNQVPPRSYSPDFGYQVPTHSRENVSAPASSKTSCCCTLHCSPLPKPLFSNEAGSVSSHEPAGPAVISGARAEGGGGQKKDWRFWMIFVSVCVTTLLVAIDLSIGIGGGGIITLGEIIICDLLPLRERGQYTGLLAGTPGAPAVADTRLAVLGGIFTQHVTWRWIFYINLPISAVALLIILPFLTLKYKRVGTVWDRTKRVDWLGNLVLIGAVTAILLALAWGGTKFAWSSWHVLLPLIMGFLGLAGFATIQVSGRVAEPTMPPRLFTNRTSVAIYVMAFVHGILLLYVTYFLPVYFQAVKSASPSRAGVALFPTATTIAPAAAISGVVITITGRYRVFHYLGFVLMSLGCGLLSLLDEHSGVAAWVGFQVLFGLGNGLAYERATAVFLASLPAAVRPLVVGIYVDALRVVWYASIAFAVAGLPICLFVRSLDLSRTLDTEFGMEEKTTRKSGRSSPA